ncbi:HTH domain-containing protein [Planctellipticum variicoloris]|uniref:HTH domain-containing protein n=1 Tax=Planctellipticum variicoloris TaxID=3064265 RepID=UPI003013C9A7|nr:HTH domain-containing protein [Planctomycetaceae bacterium SH412]
MSDSAQLIRQWTLLRLLFARRHGATLKELAADAGVSQKTILRDLKLLRRLAFPIEETVGEHGRKHWRMRRRLRLPDSRSRRHPRHSGPAPLKLRVLGLTQSVLTGSGEVYVFSIRERMNSWSRTLVSRMS